MLIVGGNPNCSDSVNSGSVMFSSWRRPIRDVDVLTHHGETNDDERGGNRGEGLAAAGLETVNLDRLGGWP